MDLHQKLVLLSEESGSEKDFVLPKRNSGSEKDCVLPRRNSGGENRVRKDIVNNVNGEWASGYWGVGGMGVIKRVKKIFSDLPRCPAF